MKGSDLKKQFVDVKVEPLDTTMISHNIESAELWIGAQSNGQRIDCTVNIVDIKTKKSVGGGRTYTGEKSNPKIFLIQAGTYEVTLKALGEFKGARQTQTITIKKGEEVRKIFEF